MKSFSIIISILGLLFIFSCKSTSEVKLNDFETWKLGWRMTESSYDEQYDSAEIQFDSLLQMGSIIDNRFISLGLESLAALEKEVKIKEILGLQSDVVLADICKKEFLQTQEACFKYRGVEQVENPDLQLEIIKMEIADQAARGARDDKMIAKFGIDTSKIVVEDGITVDKRNRTRLKEIIKTHGYPTRKMVGKEAMNGIFLIIQHADGDKDWQKSQLPFIEKAVKRGDMDGQNYAYLFDRIRRNSGQKQLYGTQFSKIDPQTKTIELAETEDMANLDKRRKEVGMMPIAMYKRMVIKHL